MDSEAVSVDALSRQVKDSIYHNTSKIRKVTEKGTLFRDKMIEYDLIPRLGEERLTFDFMKDNLINNFDWTCTKDILEEICHKFLAVLLELGEADAISLSRDLRREWNSLASDSFLIKETSKIEEYELLSSVTSLEKGNAPAIRSNKRLLESQPDNHHARIFEQSFQIIVKVLLSHDLSVPFINKLYESKLIRPAVKNAVLRIENKVIQANRIVRAVHIMMARGVVPRNTFSKFFDVVSQPEFLELFKGPLSIFLREHNDDKSELKLPRHLFAKQTSLVESEKVRLPLAQNISTEPNQLPSDPYKRQLYIKYRRLKPMSLCSPRMRRQWKYFDVVVNEKSVTTSDGSGSLDLNRIPQTDEYPPRSLILGAPGVGKSSIAIELCRRWYQRDILSEYEYVILLQADDPKINDVKDLKDLFLNPEWMDPILKANGRNSLFVIDGYSELSYSSQKFFDSLISGDILAEASLIVTSRPWCANQLTEYFPNQVEVLGFSEKICEEYIEYFSAAGNDVVEFIRHQKHIKEMFRSVPLYLSIIIEVYDEYKNSKCESKFPKMITISLLYGLLIRTLVLRYVKDSQQLSKFDTVSLEGVAPGDFSSFPRSIYFPFLKLCILAYKSQFSIEVAINPENLVRFNLLNSHEHSPFTQSAYYSFLHPSIQEYLAAFCISRMKDEELRKCLRHVAKRYYKHQLVLQFLYGFGAIPADWSRYPADSSEIVINNFSIFRQLCEASSKTLVESTFQGKSCIVRRTNPLPSFHDFWCLGKVIALSDKCDWKLGFTHRPLQNDHLKYLREGIESVEHSSTSQIKKIGLSLTMVNEIGIDYFFKSNRQIILQLSELYLDGIHLEDSVIPILCTALSKLSNLQTFLFHHNNITQGKHINLISALSKLRSLKQVSFSDLLPDECSLLVQSLKHLKVLELWHLQTHSCKALFQALEGNKNVIEELQIYDCEITLDCVNLAPIFLPKSKIAHLTFSNCGIDDIANKEIMKAVQDAGHIRSLDLSDNAITDIGGEELLELCYDPFFIDLKQTYLSNNFSYPLKRQLREAGEWNTR